MGRPVPPYPLGGIKEVFYGIILSETRKIHTNKTVLDVPLQWKVNKV